jgi:NAD(P)-dependent dehydrogenase (short-subunit alcohol dehydrogenase family)
MPSWAHCFGGRPGDTHHGDLATDHGAAAVYTEANKAFGGMDILINNAGAYEGAIAGSW